MIINVIKYANMGLSFLVELCLLAAFAYWGAHTGQELAAKIGLGVGAPLLGAIFWGVFMSPRAPTAGSQPPAPDCKGRPFWPGGGRPDRRRPFRPGLGAGGSVCNQQPPRLSLK